MVIKSFVSILLLGIGFGSLQVLAQEVPQPPSLPVQSPTAELPRFEAGIGLGFFQLPDYPGAEQSSVRILPLPYMIYRGDVIRADRDGGVRSRFFSGEHIEVDLSVGAAFPVNGSDNRGREGMPELDWMGEVGPRLVYQIIKSSRHNLLFYLPLRYAFSTDFRGVDGRGFVFAPEFVYRKRSIFHRKMSTGLSLSFNWASEDLMDYFYEVEPQYAKADRPQYDARSGYMMTNVSLFSAYVPNNKWLVFGAVSLNYYRDAKNDRSPLMLDNETQSYIFGVVWKFYESKQQAVLGSL
ncbi:MAG: MipA/OmpV family protein [Bdellovibrionota bacterium]